MRFKVERKLGFLYCAEDTSGYRTNYSAYFDHRVRAWGLSAASAAARCKRKIERYQAWDARDSAKRAARTEWMDV